MTNTSYLIAWLIYLAAAAGICIIWWKLSNNWKPVFVTQLSRYLLVVFLLTPYFSDPTQNKLAPAWLVVMFELVFGDKAVAGKAAMPLVLLAIAAVLFAYFKTVRVSKSVTP